MESTGKGREVPISVITAPPSPLPASIVKQRCMTMFMLSEIMILFFSLQFAIVRWKFEGDKESPYKTHLVLMILAWVAFVMSLISLCLMYTQKYLKTLRFYEITCFSSGLLAQLTLFLVFCLPKHQIWVGYLVLSLVSLIAAPCIWFFPKETEEEARVEHEKMTVNYSVMIFSLAIILMLHLPNSFNPIKVWILIGIIVIMVVYNAVGYYIKSIDDKKVQDLEACEVFQSSKTMA